MPMYKKLHSAIREVDDRHIILFEPTIMITSVSIPQFLALQCSSSCNTTIFGTVSHNDHVNFDSCR